ncbi:hypothetical protein B0H19DRAFT_135169 [Mycena capillaripes]|nr:hypothetical protein B0H19DRAFT_135169 [Mycena capillaripes]
MPSASSLQSSSMGPWPQLPPTTMYEATAAPSPPLGLSTSSTSADGGTAPEVSWTSASLPLPAILSIPGTPTKDPDPNDLAPCITGLTNNYCISQKSGLTLKQECRKSHYYYLIHTIEGEVLHGWPITTCGETVGMKARFLESLQTPYVHRIIPLDEPSRMARATASIIRPTMGLALNLEHPATRRSLTGFLVLTSRSATFPITSLTYNPQRSFPLSPRLLARINDYLEFVEEDLTGDGMVAGGSGACSGPGGMEGPGGDDAWRDTEQGGGGGAEEKEETRAGGEAALGRNEGQQRAGGAYPHAGSAVFSDDGEDWRDPNDDADQATAFVEAQALEAVWEDPSLPASRPSDVDEEDSIGISWPRSPMIISRTPPPPRLRCFNLRVSTAPPFATLWRRPTPHSSPATAPILWWPPKVSMTATTTPAAVSPQTLASKGTRRTSRRMEITTTTARSVLRLYSCLRARLLHSLPYFSSHVDLITRQNR